MVKCFFRICLVFCLASAGISCKKGPEPVSVSPLPSTASGRGVQKVAPQYVLDVLVYVKTHGEAPEGYVGGRTFQNREHRLPEKTSGKSIKYREWDVFPKLQGKNRGAERLITGSDQSAWYTKDHYDSFVKIE